MIIIASVLHSKVTVFSSAVNEQAVLNDAFDRAMDYAVDGIVDSADADTITVKRQQCTNNFFRALYAGLGISTDEDAKQLIQCYVPAIAFVDNDGVYIQYSDYDSTGALNRVWSKKHTFTTEKTISIGTGPNDYLTFGITYTLNDNVTVILNGKIYNGKYYELYDAYKDSDDDTEKSVFTQPVFKDSVQFDLERDSTVTDTIIKTVGYFVNRHNTIATRYGIQYSFYLPTSVYSDLARTVETVSFFAIMQGYPIGSGRDVYNQYALSGARVVRNSLYYAEYDDAGYLYYHKGNCKEYSGDYVFRGSQAECASLGAMPCHVCRP